MKRVSIDSQGTRTFVNPDCRPQRHAERRTQLKRKPHTHAVLATLFLPATVPAQQSETPADIVSGFGFGVAGLLFGIAALLIALLVWRNANRRAERNALFASIAENSRDLLTVFDASGTIIYQSPSLRDILGIEPADSVGKPYLESAMTPESKDAALQYMQGMVAGRLNDVDFESTFLRPDGSEVLMESRLHVVRRGSGIEAIYALSRDVTEKRRIEQALRESEHRFNQIAKNVSDIIYVYDRDGVINYVSPSSERVLGYTPDERIGQSFRDSLVTTPSGKARAEQVLQSLRSGEIDEMSLEMMHRRKDGSHFPGEISIRVRRSHSGRLEEIYVVVRDISRRRAAEEALRSSEERYRRLAERSVDPIVSVDTEGLMTYMSPASMRLWGATPEQLVGKHFTYGVREPSVEIIEQAVDRMRRRESDSEQVEVQHIAASGATIWTEIRAWPVFDDDEQYAGFQYLARDITEQHENRMLLIQQRTRLEARTRLLLDLNQKLDRFSATVSHDLRGPIRRILRRLGEINASGDAPQVSLDAVIAELHEMDEMVEHLLNLSLDPDTPLKREPVDIGMIARREAERLETETGREFLLQAPDSGTAMALADGALVQLVLANIIRNSCRHVDKEIDLVIDISQRDNGGVTEFCVTDNGAGFSVEDPTELFEYSVRGSDSEDGYGIGLATVYEIISRHDGYISAENSPEGGARICFTLDGGSA